MARTRLILNYRYRITALPHYRVGVVLKPLQFVLLHFDKWFTAIGNSTINTFNETKRNETKSQSHTKSKTLVVRLHICARRFRLRQVSASSRFLLSEFLRLLTRYNQLFVLMPPAVYAWQLLPSLFHFLCQSKVNANCCHAIFNCDFNYVFSLRSNDDDCHDCCRRLSIVCEIVAISCMGND